MQHGQSSEVASANPHTPEGQAHDIDRLVPRDETSSRSTTLLINPEGTRRHEWHYPNVRLVVVTVSARPLFPQVEDGTLLGTLFYRLNIVTLIAAEQTSIRPRVPPGLRRFEQLRSR